MTEKAKSKAGNKKRQMSILAAVTVLVIVAIFLVYAQEPKQLGEELAAHAISRAKEGHLEEAAMLLERAIARNPNNAAFQYNLGQAYLGLNRMPEATAALYNAVKLQPNDIQYCIEYARALSAKKSIKESLYMVERAINLGFCDMKRLNSDPDYDAIKMSEGWYRIHHLFVNKCGKNLKQ